MGIRLSFSLNTLHDCNKTRGEHVLFWSAASFSLSQSVHSQTFSFLLPDNPFTHARVSIPGLGAGRAWPCILFKDWKSCQVSELRLSSVAVWLHQDVCLLSLEDLLRMEAALCGGSSHASLWLVENWSTRPALHSRISVHQMSPSWDQTHNVT